MAFRDLYREYDTGGIERNAPMEKSLTKESFDMAPLPRIESLVNNDLTRLKSVSRETRGGIRFLFVLAHPDDEASHLVTLKMLVDMGFPVHILWLTYGDGSTSPDIKKQESQKVLSAIGGVEYTFLPHSVKDVIRDIFRAKDPETPVKTIGHMIGEVRQEVKKSEVVVTNAFEGGHLLHDFTHLVTRKTAEAERRPVLEIPQYSLKTLKNIITSLKRSLRELSLGSHTFFNVSAFRDGQFEDDIELQIAGEQIHLPGKIELTRAAVISKAGLVRQYASQWETVFSKLLEIVEFNGSHKFEQWRKARKIPALFETIMHLEKIVKSWLGLVVHPKKLYEVEKIIDQIVHDTTAQNAQQ